MSRAGSRPTFTLRWRTPRSRNRRARSAALGGSKAPTTIFIGAASRTLPPSRRYTGRPAALPAMSQQAISTAARVKGLRRRARSMRRATPRTSRGSAPFTAGSRTCEMAAAHPGLVSPLQRGDRVGSPSPTRPSSVCTFTSTYGESMCSPWAVFVVIPFLRGTSTGIGSREVILTASPPPA